MNINFIPFDESENNQLLKPVPALKKLPEWFKKKTPFTDENSKEQLFFPDGQSNISIKWCSPFGDALGFGYFILLENDIHFGSDENGQLRTVWHRGGEEFVSNHDMKQISDDLIPEGYRRIPLKFINFWGIKTPSGYSTFFTHPLNRTELPFITLSGVVDTDSYNQPVNFPFVIKKDFEGILEAGTPIAQVIPFKRESWKAVFEDFDIKKIQSIQGNFKRKMKRVYRLNYWNRKEFK